MNREQARAAMRGWTKKAKKKDLNDPRQAQAMLESLPTETLVAGINNSLGILQRRGIPISDWDSKGRELYRLKVFNGKVYFLAAELDRVNGAPHGKQQDILASFPERGKQRGLGR